MKERPYRNTFAAYVFMLLLGVLFVSWTTKIVLWLIDWITS